MTIQTHNESRSALVSERQRNADEASAMDDARIAIRDCEDAVAELLKDFDSDAVFTILARLEDAKGVAGARVEALK